jgi:hypothetical protein
MSQQSSTYRTNREQRFRQRFNERIWVNHVFSEIAHDFLGAVLYFPFASGAEKQWESDRTGFVAPRFLDSRNRPPRDSSAM